MYAFESAPSRRPLHVLILSTVSAALLLVCAARNAPFPFLLQGAAVALLSVAVYWTVRYALRRYRYAAGPNGVVDAHGAEQLELVVTEIVGRRATVVARVPFREIDRARVAVLRRADRRASAAARAALCRGRRVLRFVNVPAFPAACYVPVPCRDAVLVIPPDPRMVDILRGERTGGRPGERLTSAPFFGIMAGKRTGGDPRRRTEREGGTGRMSHRLRPDYMFRAYDEITPEFLRGIGVRAVLTDIDNTLAPYEQEEPDEDLRRWIGALAAAGISLAFVSNNDRERVERFNRSLGLPAYWKSRKPLTGKLRLALRDLGCGRRDAAVLGDQVLTDVYAGKRAGLTAILVPPIHDRTTPFFRFKRWLEGPVVRRYKRDHGVTW